MTVDSQNMLRRAQRLVVQARRSTGTPPSYEPNWQLVWNARVELIEIRAGDKFSRAVIWFPTVRWQADFGLNFGDMIRIRTDRPSDNKVIFSGFLTSFTSEFSGGGKPAGGYERVAVVCMDYRWLLSVTSPIFGQAARGPDDYTDYGTGSQAPIADSFTMLWGRRGIFNENGRANRDPVDLTAKVPEHDDIDIPLFSGGSDAVTWTARQMIRYILSSGWNRAYQYFPIPDPADLIGLAEEDFDRVLSHIVIDGLNIVEAISLICGHLGYSFREDYGSDGSVNLVFYKLAAASSYIRSDTAPTILHWLHAPAVGEAIDTAIAEGRRMIYSMSLLEDISALVNQPWGLGSPHRFEFTAELIPAWLESEFAPDSENLFFNEADLQAISSPDDHDFYKYYHIRGSNFKRDVGRKWTLNETGKYSDSTTYDRGMPFDFADVLEPGHILDSQTGRRLYAPFNRPLLGCLTFDKDTLNSVGIKVEFSFDGGTTWQVIPAAISALPSEGGIYIDDPNLAELVDKAEGTISGGTYDGVPLNLFSSLADDKANSRVFKDGDWHTRVRVTASVQMDQRLISTASATKSSGSPFDHARVYNFSDSYGLTKRTASSSFYDSGLPSWDTDERDKFDKHIQAIRDANEDTSISGRFTLDRLWLTDNADSDIPFFACGDSIEKITGREYSLSASLYDQEIFPEIIQITYLPNQQKQQLITRDLRLVEVY